MNVTFCRGWADDFFRPTSRTKGREQIVREPELFATARVSIVVEVDAASWQVSSSAEQIFKAAGEEAKNRLLILFQKERGIRVIGDPSVTLVTGVRKP
jgi:hypothetical protein